MKQFTFLRKTLLLTAMMGWTMMGNAQRYETDHGKVYFGNELVVYADARSFVDLGCGYGKDSFNVYYCGEKVKGAMASSFKYTGDGYGQDAFDAYFRGKKIE